MPPKPNSTYIYAQLYLVFFVLQHHVSVFGKISLF